MGVKLIDTVAGCQEAVDVLSRCTEVALDIEGVDHGRDGKLF